MNDPSWPRVRFDGHPIKHAPAVVADWPGWTPGPLPADDPRITAIHYARREGDLIALGVRNGTVVLKLPSLRLYLFADPGPAALADPTAVADRWLAELPAILLERVL